GHGVDAVIGQMISVADTGKHQQLWAVDGTAAEHHLAVCVCGAYLTVAFEFHTDSTGSVNEDSGDEGIGQHGEILAEQRRLDVGVRGAVTRAAAPSADRLSK